MSLNLRPKLLALDTECTGLNPYGNFKRWGFYPARPFAFSFCDMEGNTEYYRWKVDPFTRKVIPESSSFAKINKLLSDPTVAKIGHNISYDLRMLQASGFKVKGKVHDSLILAHVITGGSEFSYALKPLGVKYLGVSDSDEKDLQESTVRARNKGKKLGWSLATKEFMGKEPIKADYWMADPELCKTYAIKDAERTMMFYQLFIDEVMNDPNMRQVYEREMKVFWVVKKMEDLGTRVFPKEIVSLRNFYESYMKKQIKVADQNGGKGLNFRSHKQMTQKFFVEKGYKPLKLTKGGNPKLDGELLAGLAEKDKLAKAILEYRGAGHMLSAFLDPYERFMVQESSGAWVLHPNFRQCGPVTGRFACSDPNLMQVASETTGRRKTDITLRPREAFGPREGCLWYMPDYSQMEVWVFAFLAQDQAMMDTLLAGGDFHGDIAKQTWGNEPDYEARKSYYRKRAKLLMFCKIYGGGVNKIAYLLECPKDEASVFVNQYDARLPGVQKFMKRMINKASREGQVINPWGRIYFIDKNFAYRAVNYLIQGSCADIMKSAMINMDKVCCKWSGVHMLLTLHDELILEVPKKYHSKKLMKEIISAMQGDFHKRLGMPVPIPVSMKIATRRWSEYQEIKL